MACNNCNNTSTDCNHLACGCADTSQTMPCTYTDCRKDGAESCDEVMCAACISYCAATFEASLGGEILQIAQGERLDRILQRIVLFMTNASCVATAPQLVSLGDITTTSVEVEWSGVPSTATVDVQYKIPTSGGWTTAASGLASSTTSHIITNLTANSAYQFRVVNGSCSSVILTGSTLAA